jgi:hypothetical protein
MAAFVVFLLVGIHAPVGHAMPRTQNPGQARAWKTEALGDDLEVATAQVIEAFNHEFVICQPARPR